MKHGFAKECSILSACSYSSNVVSCYALGELSGSTHSEESLPCMLMELSQLGDAQNMFQPAYNFNPPINISGMAGTMSTLQAQHIIRQVARGLAAVHAVPAIFCDLKRANLLLFGDAGAPQVKLTDFTTSITEGYNPSADMIGISEGWASPETEEEAEAEPAAEAQPAAEAEPEPAAEAQPAAEAEPEPAAEAQPASVFTKLNVSQ
jgi:serine/threonine protein kinase